MLKKTYLQFRMWSLFYFQLTTTSYLLQYSLYLFSAGSDKIFLEYSYKPDYKKETNSLTTSHVTE
jgi:hypothetical protein